MNLCINFVIKIFLEGFKAEIFMNFLKISYQIGGAYDTILGLGILFLRNYLLTFLHQKIPVVPQIADALGLFLIAYGFLLIDESRKSDTRFNVGFSSAVVRIIFFILVVLYLVFSSVELLYIVLSCTDLLTGLFLLYGISSVKYSK